MTLSKKLEAEVNAAVEMLASRLVLSVATAPTHRVLEVTGWGDPALTRAIAGYLVALRVLAVDSALRIRAELADTDRDRLELWSNITAIVGDPPSSLTPVRKRDERNPCLAEGLWHLCLFLASRRAEFHPFGTLLAISQPNVTAKDHGIDIAALYHESATEIGLSLVETKAYQDRPSDAIEAAAEFFRAVDSGTHDLRARQITQAMRNALPPEQQPLVRVSLWKQHRAYIPNPHYDATNSPRWGRARRPLKGLAVRPERICIMPHAITDFTTFFDALAQAMYDIAAELQGSNT